LCGWRWLCLASGSMHDRRGDGGRIAKAGRTRERRDDGHPRQGARAPKRAGDGVLELRARAPRGGRARR
jgi:hypothetical protein